MGVRFRVSGFRCQGVGCPGVGFQVSLKTSGLWFYRHLTPETRHLTSDTRRILSRNGQRRRPGQERCADTAFQHLLTLETQAQDYTHLS